MYAYNSSYEGVLERQRDPLNTVNNPAFDIAGANMMGTIDGMEKVHDEATQNSGSGDSNLSNLSALENETDDFGRLLLQHERDARRLNNAVRGGKEQAFRKARTRPGVAERLEREERERLANGQNHERISAGGSPASDGVEPPVTVPREWGRKARKQTDWLKKIVAPSEDGDNHEVNGDEGEIYQRNTAFTGDLDWQDVTNKPLQSIENTPPSIRRYQDPDTPSSLNHMNTTLKPTYDFEDKDFTSTSFVTSTPAPTRYHRKIDELARQELEELEIKAVTTRALDQIDSRSPNAVLRSRSNSKLRERASVDRLRSPLMSPEKSSSPSRIPVRRQRLTNNKENAPPNGYLKAERKPALVTGAVNSRIRTANAEKSSIGLEKRPLHGRNDSMNLLKKLARVSSLSPSPARPKSEPVDVKDKEDVDHEDGQVVSAVGDNVGKDDLEPQADVESRPTVDDEDAKAEYVYDDEDPNDFVQWNPEQAAFVDKGLPSSKEVLQEVSVELVTPLDEHGQPLELTKSLEEEMQIQAIVEGVAKVMPDHPKSALEAIVREMKAERDAPQYGESTIQSLEDIVHPDVDPTITFDFDARDVQHEEENLDAGQPLTQAEKDRRQEDLAMEAMNKHLRTARTSIKDANRGLRRVENRIDTTEERPFTKFVRNAAPSKTVIIAQAEEFMNKTYCPDCGCHQQSVWKGLYLEFRSLFYTYDETSRPLHRYVPIPIRIRLTRLGLFVVLWWAWYIIECVLCDIYCHPLYTPRLFTSSRDYPFGNGPVFPFVIPTLILRPIFRPLKPLWNPAKQALMAYYHAYVGNPGDMWRSPYKRWMPDPNGRPMHVSPAEFDAQWSSRFSRFRTTFAPQLARATQTMAATLARATHSFLDALDQAEYMWNDELLT